MEKQRIHHRVSLLDVARLAQVSRGAAGKVLNGGSEGIRVGAEARERILAAAKELDYRPNMAASILAGGASKLIGVLMDSGINYRSSRLLCELERICSERGYRLMTSFTHDNVQDMVENYRTMERYGVSGVIWCSHDYPACKDELERFLPECQHAVFMERPFQLQLPHVSTSRRAALTAMIREALESGHKRFGLVVGNDAWESERRLRVEFGEAMATNGLEVSEGLIAASPRVGLSAAERVELIVKGMVLKERPDFLFVDDAVIASGLMVRLLREGYQLDICGGNGNPQFATMGLRSLDPCYEVMAEKLLQLLLEPETLTMDQELVVEARYDK